MKVDNRFYLLDYVPWPCDYLMDYSLVFCVNEIMKWCLSFLNVVSRD